MPSETTGILASLVGIQSRLKVEKRQFNSFGGYKFRSKEDILEAAKPLCAEMGLVIECDDEPVLVGTWVYVRTTAKLLDSATGAHIEATGLAREPESRKGMDASQITGTASSYAGKRALGNLFALDDTADADAQPAQADRTPSGDGPFVARCRSCGTAYQFANKSQYEAFVRTASCCPNPDWGVD